MRFEVGQGRIGLAAGSFFLVLSAITVGLIVIAAALISSQGTGSLPANSNTLNSSSLGSSSVFSSSASFIQSTVQSSSASSDSGLNQSAPQYPLVWAPNSPSGCYYDQYSFCVEAVLGFSDNATIAFTATSSTTIIEGNATTIIHYDTVNTTTIIRTGTETVSCQGADNATLSTNHTSSVSSTSCTSSVTTYPETDFIVGPENASHAVAIWAVIQNATTGQYITTGGGGSFVSNVCDLNPTGYTKCYAPGYLSEVWPGPLSYKVTVFITKGELPCQLQEVNSSCSIPLLAPIQTIAVTE
jgi:hypothetical protein